MQPETVYQAVVLNSDTGLIVGISRAATIPDAVRNALSSQAAQSAGAGEFYFEVYAVDAGELEDGA